jgi:hypothetical protein
MENVQAVTPAFGLQHPAARASRIEAAPAVQEAAPAALEGPNAEGDDAPPALPAALQRFAAASAVRPTTTVTAMPANVRPTVDPNVAQASAEIQAGGAQLINPAALEVDQAAGGVEQAIYVEASDLPAN